MDIASKSKKITSGIVLEALADALFRVELVDTKQIVLAYLAGKLRMHHIRVLVGDRVELELEPYGGKARIVRRMQ